jgi:hypothetical protein
MTTPQHIILEHTLVAQKRKLFRTDSGRCVIATNVRKRYDNGKLYWASLIDSSSFR